MITRQGFQFLLLDRQAQVWHFLLQYLDTVEQRGLDLAECLTFLFQLSFSTLGKVCFIAIYCHSDVSAIDKNISFYFAC